MLEKPNYKFNKNMPMPDRFINGQALGMVSRLRYGLFPMSYNGCEIIAVYNYMRLHGVKTNMADLALEIYPKGLGAHGAVRFESVYAKALFPKARHVRARHNGL